MKLHAVRLLNAPRLNAEYAQAFTEMDSSGDATLWDQTAHDGLTKSQQ